MNSHKNGNAPAPANEDVRKDAEELVAFLKDSKSKAAMKDFIVETFKQFEAERVEQFKAKVNKEHQVDSQSANGYHPAGNIAPLLAEAFNMHPTEGSFVRSLKVTQASLNRTVEQRVEEINRLLAGIGGFCSQLKSCFARSTVVFLEKEDPRRPFRERLIFSINLPNYELKMPLGRTENGKGAPKADGRSLVQATWDGAVNALAQIIESTGLKPKYCKNDRHFGRFVMKQDLLHSSHLPDEYFSFTLDYNTAEKIQEMKAPYNSIMAKYDRQLGKWSKSLDRYPEDSKNPRYLVLKKKYLTLLQERDYFAGTTPDPNQLDEGLLFLIEVSTLKDYQMVKDRMQSIMTRYILHLSKIAAEDARQIPDLHHEIDAVNRQLNAPKAQLEKLHEDDGLDEVDEYEIDVSALKPVARKRAG
jgi:hypothetical protein